MDKSVKYTLLIALSLSIVYTLYKLFSGPANCEIKGVHIDRATIVAGESIMVTDSSDGVSSRVWDFGDGQESSNEKSLKHTYTNPGEFPLTLTINNKCSFDTLIKVLPAKQSADLYANAEIEFPAKEMLKINTKLIFKVNKKGLTSYDWSFGENGAGKIDMSLSNTNEVSYTYSVPNVYTIYLTLDKTQTISKSIKIRPKESGTPLNSAKIGNMLQAMFSAASEPSEVDNYMKQLARLLCNNRSVTIEFIPSLKMSSEGPKSSLSLKDLANRIGLDSYYQRIKVSKIKIPENSGNCPEKIVAYILQ